MTKSLTLQHPDPAAIRIHTDSMEEASEQLASFLKIRYVQLERGPVGFQGSAARIGRTIVARIHADRNKVERIKVPRDRILLLLSTLGLARVGTTTLRSGEAALVRGSCELVAFTDRDCLSLLALLPAPEQAPYEFESVINVRSARAQSLVCFPQFTGAQAFHLAECIEAALDVASTTTSRCFEQSARSTLETSLLSACNPWLQRERMPEQARAAVAARRHAAVRAQEYIDRNLDKRLSLANVCQASYSSPRALEYGFREVFGISPMVYARCSRLARVRRELYVAPQVTGIVTRLAMKWGFWHLSQFSKDYHDLFGELPSTTLIRANKRGSRPCVVACDRLHALQLEVHSMLPSAQGLAQFR